MFIGLTYDLRTEYEALGYTSEQVAEFDSESTIAAVESTIQSLGHRTERIGHARALAERLVAGRRWDLVFNIAEGLFGRSREGQVPSLLELYGIAYTFADPLVCALTLDKALTKRLVRAAGLATPDFAVVAELADLPNVRIRYPAFAKPLAEGTGKGITGRSRVNSPEHLSEVCADLLARFAQPVLVEEYLPGREFTVGILGTGSKARVLGTMEIEILPAATDTVYSYDNKERCEQLVRYSRMPDGALKAEGELLALKAYRVLECRDAARVDIRCDAAGEPSFLEVNPLAGIHPTHSDLPMIATQEGMTYPELIDAILRSASERMGSVPPPRSAAPGVPTRHETHSPKSPDSAQRPR